MEIVLYKDAKLDLEYWRKSSNKVVQNKIQELFVDMKKHQINIYSLRAHYNK